MTKLTGIKHYTTATKGTGGAIKKRVSDFIVQEITLEGKTLENTAFGEWPEKRGTKLVIPESQGKEQLHLTMEKFNKDTNDAVRQIARHCRVSQKRIGYAGMKDKRAITAQRISVWRPDVERLEGFDKRYVALRDAEWGDERIEIGSLEGNRFTITIREIGLSEEELGKTIEQCFEEMREGVANYFGEQRFGGAREITHVVGREFIKGNFEKGVMLYLTSPSKEEEEISIARKNLADTKDFAKAVKEFPSKFRYERSIIHHLCRYPKDFVGAFQNMPKHLTYMFTHAYQSYLFNQVINKRIETGLGLKPVEGDVLQDGAATAPLFGFESELSGGKPGEIEKDVLVEEGASLGEFKVKSFPELSCRGARKKMLLIPHELEIVSIGEDELNTGKLKAKIGFRLEKGAYATTILREIMKNHGMQGKAHARAKNSAKTLEKAEKSPLNTH